MRNIAGGMMKLSALLVCCFTLYIERSEAHQPCPQYWTKSSTSCYRLFGQTTNWFTAENICRLFSGCSGGIGHLASIGDAQENEFVFNMLKSTSGQTIPPQVWLGGRRYPNTQRWEWSDGTFMVPSQTYSAWQESSEPHVDRRNCLVFGNTGLPTWIGVNCQDPSPYICELPANLLRDPASCAAPVPLRERRVENSPYGPEVSTFRYTKSGNVEQRFTGRA